MWGQDGWMLAKFFFCVFIDGDEVEKDWSIKDLLLYGKKRIFSTRPWRTNAGNQILPAGEANQNAGSWIQPYNKRRLIVLIDLPLRQYNQSSSQAVNTNSRENLEVKKV